MNTCPQCGRHYPDDAVLCTIDNTSLIPSSPGGDLVDQETRVRPKAAQPIASPRFTEIPLERPAASTPAARPPAPPQPMRIETRRPTEERPMWPIIAVFAVLILGAVGLSGWWVMSSQSDLAREVGAQISDARVQVADARARLESLPADNPLRSKLLQLQEWDRELQRFELGGDRTRDMASRAREIAGQARSVGEEARIAGAIISATPPVVPPAVPQPAVEDPTTAGTPESDPMATGGGTGAPPDTNAATNQAKPPETTAGAPTNTSKPDEKPPQGDPGTPKTDPKPGDPPPPAPKDGAAKPEPKPDPPPDANH